MKKGDLFVFGVILLLLIGGSIYFLTLNFNQNSPSVAKVFLFGKLQKTIDLKNVKEPFDFTIMNDNGGSNVIHVEKGKICVLKANCPDQICVKRGYVTSKAAPAVCIPNGVVIEVDTQNKSNSDDTDSIDLISE